MSAQHATAEHAEGQQHHPISSYLWVWLGLFVLSALSYTVDVVQVRPFWLHAFLITAFSLFKAGLIVAFFMHLKFERFALVYTILLPPILILALVAIAIPEGAYVSSVRELFFGE